VIDRAELMKQIKENHKKLEGCGQHNFSIDATPDKKFSKRYKCINCGGEVSYSDKHWYEKGLEQAENYI
jgi:DNA-directed RNA polymerase subunit RPC12/RpoP